MWKKNEANDSSKGPTPAPSVAVARVARIGGSLSIQGDLYGEEDLFIEGRIEGKITVKKGSVTVAEKGRVHADIKATNIHVAGEVEGDLTGREQVVLLETGRVHGNIKAKSVTLQNGAQLAIMMTIMTDKIDEDMPTEQFYTIWKMAKHLGKTLPETRQTSFDAS